LVRTATVAMAEIPSESLFIGELPETMDDARLRAVFGAYATIKSSKLLPVSGHRGSRAAIITFESLDEAKWIVDNLHENIPQGLEKPVLVKFKKQENKGVGKGAPWAMTAQDPAGGGKAWAGKDGGEASWNSAAWPGKGGSPAWGNQAAWGGKGGKEGGETTWGDKQGSSDPSWGSKANAGKAVGNAPWGAKGVSGTQSLGASPSEDAGDAGGAASESPGENLLIGNLPGFMDEQKMRSVFNAYGTIKHLKMMPPGADGMRSALMQLGSLVEATWIFENLDGNLPQGLSGTDFISVKYKASEYGKAELPNGKGGQHGSSPYDRAGADKIGRGEASWGGKAGKGGTEDASCGGKGGKTAGWSFEGAQHGGDAASSGGGSDLSWGGEKSAPVGGKGADTDASWAGAGGDASWGGRVGGDASGAEAADPEAPSTKVYIARLPSNLDDSMLLSVFGAYGTIVDHRVLPRNASGTRAAIIQFASISEATWIVENLNGNLPQGLVGTDSIEVKYKSEGKGKDKAVGKGAQHGAGPYDRVGGKGFDDDAVSGGKASGKGAVDDGSMWGGKAGKTTTAVAAGNAWGGKANSVDNSVGGMVVGGDESATAATPASNPTGGAAEKPAMDSVHVTNLPFNADEEMMIKVFGAYGTILKTTLLPKSPGADTRAAVLQFETEEEATWLVENLDGKLPHGLTGTDQVFVKYKTVAPAKVENVDAKGKGGKGKPAISALPDASDAGAGLKSAKGNAAGGWGKGCKGNDASACGKASKPIIIQHDPVKGGPGGPLIRALVDGLKDSGAIPAGTKDCDDEATVVIGGLPYDTTDVDLYWIFAPFGPIPPSGVSVTRNANGQCNGDGFVVFLDAGAARASADTLNGTLMPDGSSVSVSIKSESVGGGNANYW